MAWVFYIVDPGHRSGLVVMWSCTCRFEGLSFLKHAAVLLGSSGLCVWLLCLPVGLGLCMRKPPPFLEAWSYSKLLRPTRARSVTLSARDGLRANSVRPKAQRCIMGRCISQRATGICPVASTGTGSTGHSPPQAMSILFRYLSRHSFAYFGPDPLGIVLRICSYLFGF